MDDDRVFERMRDLLDPVRHIRQRVVSNFMRRANVVACGVGLKITDDELIPEPSIVVSVTRKQPRDTLSLDDLIPRRVEDVLTDVIEVGRVEALGFNRMAASRPVRPGSSIGHQDGTAGTAGCIVQRDGEQFILSNNHVLALLNAAEIGDVLLQPGPGDGGTLSDAIGELAQFVPIKFIGESVKDISKGSEAETEELRGCAAALQPLLRAFGGGGSTVVVPPSPVTTTNLVDAALVRPFDSVTVNPEIIDIGAPPGGVVRPELGMRVVKSGRTSGITQGRVVQIDVTVDVTYTDRVARFTNQLMISPFSQRGDSGSLVLDFDRNAVGLLFSGSDVISIVSPIQNVMRALNVNLVLSL